MACLMVAARRRQAAGRDSVTPQWSAPRRGHPPPPSTDHTVTPQSFKGTDHIVTLRFTHTHGYDVVMTSSAHCTVTTTACKMGGNSDYISFVENESSLLKQHIKTTCRCHIMMLSISPIWVVVVSRQYIHSGIKDHGRWQHHAMGCKVNFAVSDTTHSLERAHNCNKAAIQETSSAAVQRGRALLRVIKYFAKSLNVIRNDTLEQAVCKSLFH